VAFDKRVYFNLFMELMQTGDYEGVLRRIQEVAERDPHEYYLTHVQIELVNLNELKSVLDDTGILQEPYFRVVVHAIFDLAGRAMEADYPTYAEFSDEFKSRLMFDLEVMKRMTHPYPLMPERNLSNVSECLNSIRDFLETYQRRLRFYRGLLDIVRNKKPSFKRSDKLTVPAIERDLSIGTEGLGKGMVLGDEYRHIRNSLGHNTWRVYDKDRAVEFVDRNPKTGDVWKEEYDFVGFAVLYRHLLIYMNAMALADAASRVTEFSFLAEAYDDSDPRDK
jgi:hypothetical protein